MYKIDKTDLQIIECLMEDGRMQAAEIGAPSGGISGRAIRYRIERMMEEGVIRVTAVVNPKVIGLTVVADVWLSADRMPFRKWRRR